MKKTGSLSKDTILSEYEGLFNSYRKGQQEITGEDNKPSLSLGQLCVEELPKESLWDIYPTEFNNLECFIPKTTHKDNDIKKRTRSLERSGSQSRSVKDSPDNPGSLNENADIADDFEMMKEKYRKWKKKMDREG